MNAANIEYVVPEEGIDPNGYLSYSLLSITCTVI